MTRTMPETVLVLGPTGKFGRHAAATFEARGWQVRRFRRGVDDLRAAATGAAVIVMGWHPPSYEDWAREMMPMHARVIEVAKATGASVIVPGNVYVYGPDAPFGWTAETLHLASNPLGRLRIGVEAAYRDAGVRTILLRCGDFIDDRASGNWFDRFITPRAAKGSISYPGPVDVPHAWAFLPDVARAAVLLAERRDSLATFEDVPFAGYTLTGAELANGIGQALGHEVRPGRFAWLPLRLARPVMPVLRGVFEMRYLWSLPHRLDGGKLARLCPEFVPTPLDDALRAGLAHQSGGAVAA